MNPFYTIVLIDVFICVHCAFQMMYFAKCQVPFMNAVC